MGGRRRKYTQDEALEILRYFIRYGSYTYTARKFSTSVGNVRNIAKSSTYRDVREALSGNEREALNTTLETITRGRRSDAALSDRQAREIVQRYIDHGVTTIELAAEYGVSRALINHILHGAAYRSAWPGAFPHDAVREAAGWNESGGKVVRARVKALKKLSAREVGEIKGIIQWAEAHPFVRPNLHGIGRIFGVSREMVRLIKAGRSHKWIDAIPYTNGESNFKMG